ncbi:MAG: hypothetical protein SPL82_15530, partial [Lachnospiraceae bacterium]|nr:hypothetical protein [Lachnospiraceae bacterium]
MLDTSSHGLTLFFKEAFERDAKTGAQAIRMTDKVKTALVSYRTHCYCTVYFPESSEILLATAPCWLWYLASFLLL